MIELVQVPSGYYLTKKDNTFYRGSNSFQDGIRILEMLVRMNFPKSHAKQGTYSKYDVILSGTLDEMKLNNPELFI